MSKPLAIQNWQVVINQDPITLNWSYETTNPAGVKFRGSRIKTRESVEILAIKKIPSEAEFTWKLNYPIKRKLK